MLDLAALATEISHHGQVVRIVVANVRGSAPRETGTSMLVWADGFSGTIGGGRLELEAIASARHMLTQGPETQIRRQALGPALHQCCGGAVVLVTDLFDAARLALVTDAIADGSVWARPVEPGAGSLPNTAAHLIEAATDTPINTTLSGGWLLEPVWRMRLPVYIYGAGHVGRALAQVLAPLPQFKVTLADIRPDQFDDLPDAIVQSRGTPLPQVIADAPADAAHFIMTPDHDHDLALCHALLQRPFQYAGLIGSATKWARFRTRLGDLGHSARSVERITCPIGDPSLGKDPQAIALGVATGLLKGLDARHLEQERRA